MAPNNVAKRRTDTKLCKKKYFYTEATYEDREANHGGRPGGSSSSVYSPSDLCLLLFVACCLLSTVHFLLPLTVLTLTDAATVHWSFHLFPNIQQCPTSSSFALVTVTLHSSHHTVTTTMTILLLTATYCLLSSVFTPIYYDNPTTYCCHCPLVFSLFTYSLIFNALLLPPLPSSHFTPPCHQSQ